MKPRRILSAARLSLPLATALAALATPLVNAAIYYWDSDGTTAGFGTTDGTWGTSAFWSTVAAGTGTTANTTTTSLDDLWFGTTATGYTGGRTVTVNGTQNARLLSFGAASGAVTLSGGTIALGDGGGITLEAGAANDATVNSNLSIAGRNTLTIGSGRTLTLSTGAFTRNAGALLSIQNSGTLTSTMTGLSNGSMVNGIIGPWASIGSGASTSYATFSGNNIIALTGTAAATGANLTDATGTVNYDLAAASGTVQASMSANTIRYTGGIGTTAPGATLFSVNGLMNAGSGTWTIGTNQLTIGSAKELVINTASADITISSLIANNAGGASSIIKTGSGILTLSALNSYTGNIWVNAGTLKANKNTGTATPTTGPLGNPQIAGRTLTISPGATLEFTAGNAMGNGIIGSQPKLTIIVNGGTILNTIADTNPLGPVQLNGGTINSSQGDVTYGGILLSGTVTVGGSAVSTIASAGGGAIPLQPGTTFNVADVVSGSDLNVTGVLRNYSGSTTGGLVKTGLGTMTLSGANTYTGTTTVSAGTLALDFTSGSNRINSTSALALAGGTLQMTALGTNTQTFGTTTLSSGGNIITRSGTWTSGVSNLGTMSGSGLLDVSDLTTSASWIKASGNLSQSYLLNGNVTANSGASLVKTDASGNLLTVATTDYASNATINVNPTTDARLVSSGGTGGGASGSNVFLPVGTTDIGTLVNAYTSGIQIIDVTNNGANTGNILRMGATGIITSSAGGALTIGTGANVGVLTAGGADNTAGTLYFNNANAITVNSAIKNNGSGAVTLSKTGAGTLTLSNANTYTGTTTISAGTLQIGGSGSLNSGSYAGAITFSNSSLLQYSSSAAQTLSGAITGAGRITKDTNTGDLTLSNTGNTFTGTTTISAGRILITAQSNASATSIVQSGTGQLFVNAANVNLTNNFNISTTGYAEGGDSQNNVDGAIRTTNFSNLSGTITLSGNSRVGLLGSTGNLTPTTTYSGQITGNAGIDFYGFQANASATETFVISNTNNNYTGNTTIYNSNYNATNLTSVGTTLKLGASNVIPDGANAGNVVFAINGTNNNATVRFDLAGFSETINGTTVNPGTFATNITNSSTTVASTLTVGANNTTSAFSGSITDSDATFNLALSKTGSGTFTLTGSNTYRGATTVSNGTLIVNGNISTSVLTTVNSGATLGGSGTVGALTINSGGFHNPGNSPAIQNTGNYSLAGTLGIEINGNTPGITGYDQVNTTGSVTLSGLLAITMGYTPIANQLFFIIANDGSDPITGTFSNAAIDGNTYTLGGQAFQISYFGNQTSPGVGTFTGGNDVVLMAVIPEPRSALLGGLGLLMLLRRRRN